MPTVELRRAADRACTRTEWLTSWHSFSYGEHYDAANVGFGALVVSNHDVLAAGAGFDSHQHSGVDLVTVVLSGVLEHRDSHGRAARLSAGGLQVLHAGTVVAHSERNGSTTEPVEYVQMWLRSADPVSSYERPPSTRIVLAAGEVAVVDLDPGRAHELPGSGLAHAYLVEGRVRAHGLDLSAGDALRVRGKSVAMVAQSRCRLVVATLRKG